LDHWVNGQEVGMVDLPHTSPALANFAASDGNAYAGSRFEAT
jgi:hypothetical protein